jgi:hypothetical protein
MAWLGTLLAGAENNSSRQHAMELGAPKPQAQLGFVLPIGKERAHWPKARFVLHCHYICLVSGGETWTDPQGATQAVVG